MNKHLFLQYVFLLFFYTAASANTGKPCEHYGALGWLSAAKHYFAGRSITEQCQSLVKLLVDKGQLSLAEQERAQSECGPLVDDFWNVLDCKPSEFNEICFEEKWVNEFHSDENTRYLQELWQAMGSAPLTSKFNVWDWTLQYFKRKPGMTVLEAKKRAADILAMNFQDLSKAYLQNFTNNSKKTPSYKALEKIINEVRTSPDRIQFLPPGVEGQTMKSYHYYVIGSAALKMKEKYPNNPMAALLPVVFNTKYELYSAGEDSGDVIQTNIRRYETSDRVKVDYDDIYLGFQGYQTIAKNNPPVKFDEFMKQAENYHTYLVEALK